MAGSARAEVTWAVAATAPEMGDRSAAPEAASTRELRKRVFAAIAEVSDETAVTTVLERLTPIRAHMCRVRVRGVVELLPAFAAISPAAPTMEVSHLACHGGLTSHAPITCATWLKLASKLQTTHPNGFCDPLALGSPSRTPSSSCCSTS